MNIQNIPAFVRLSGVFSEEELTKLSCIGSLPSEREVDDIRHLPEIQELNNAFIGDESTRTIHQLLKAKQYLEMGNVDLAWRVILL